MGVAEALQLAFALEPQIPILIADIKKLFAKHPALADPAAQQAFITAVVQGAAAVDDAALSKWNTDQATNKG